MGSKGYGYSLAGVDKEAAEDVHRQINTRPEAT
jgi:hypothetical protein